MRDIAARARVNVAAGNYHYGSKKALYLAVLRAHFAEVQALLRRRGAELPEPRAIRLPRAELIRRLRARVRAMLDLLIGPPPSRHGALMLREMADPTEALAVVVEEFIRPRLEELEAIIARLEPRLEGEALRRCALSVVAQAVFYRTTMPALLFMRGERCYPRTLAPALAAHVTEFSLGGMARVAARRRRGG
jgi:AcrR family transcriptional regulator